MVLSLGVSVAASSGSWDITNHLLNKPETFFSAPHAGLYGGVVLIIIAMVFTVRQYRSPLKYIEHKSKSMQLNKNLDIDLGPSRPFSVKLIILGAVLLIIAGPFDFTWHSAFGLDGLLSPSHLTLAIGLLMTSVGSFVGILSYVNFKSLKHEKHTSCLALGILNGHSPDYLSNKSTALVIIAAIPVWITLIGLIHMLSLPFSNTEFFKFNPDPIVGAVFAAISLPLVGSFIVTLSFRLTRKFWTISILGAIFILINLITSILPNEYLVPTIPFYLLNFIPFLAIDIILAKLFVRYKVLLGYAIAGTVLGVTFYMLYFPLVTYTYNEIMPNRSPVWPSIIILKYFEIIRELYPIIVLPALPIGLLGAIFASSRIINQAKIIK
jgi:hypothetical protein